MERIDRLSNQHLYSARVGAAMVYAVAAAVALNYFWTPGHIYSSGFMGMSQLFSTIGERTLGFTVPVYLIYLLVNIPLVLAAWFKIGHRFTYFSALAVFLAALAMRFIHEPSVPWVRDPLVDAIFGGAINGFGTGMALRNGLSTGGLDVIGIILRRATGMKMGAANLTFNFFILLGSGIMFGPEYALYTGIGLVVNARVIDLVYTRQQKMQVMIVTEQREAVIEALQKKMRRGITVLHDAEGGFNHRDKEVLFTVISAYEQYDLQDAIHEADPVAWSSAWRVDRTFGRFFEPRL